MVRSKYKHEIYEKYSQNIHFIDPNASGSDFREWYIIHFPDEFQYYSDKYNRNMREKEVAENMKRFFENYP